MRNFLRDGHTIAIVDDIEYAELAVALQNVSNEVHRPGDIFLVRCHERILDSGWQAFAQRLSLVEMNRLVDTVDLLMVPGMPILANQPEYFPEALVGDLGLLPYRSLDLGIILGRFVVEERLVDAHQSARPSNADVVFLCYLARNLLAGLGRQSFFSMTSRRISLSRARLAYIFLSLAFSSSSSFSFLS